MSEELRVWLNELRYRGIGSETAALLIDKCEELVEAMEAGQEFLREVAYCDECRQTMSLFCIIHSVELVEVAGKHFVALRAPGGGERG